MKFDLLSSASVLAIGAGIFGMSTGAANATLTCGVGSCFETVSPGAIQAELSNLNSVILLDEFNPGLNQHLTSVDVVYNMGFTSSGTLTNITGQTQSLGFRMGMDIVPGTTTAPTGFPLLSVSFNPGAGLATSFPSVAPGASVSYSTNHTFAPVSGSTTSHLSDYLGTGTFSIYFTSSTSQTFSGSGGNGSASLTTYATPSVTITYDFTTSVPTPEPATLAVFGVAMAGLGVIRRRRKSA